MAWTNITNAQLAIGAPLRSIDILALRDNITAQANGDAGAPKQQTNGIEDAAITAPKMNFVANGLRNNGGSLDIGCPTFNTIGSYCYGKIQINNGNSISSGNNYPAGTGNLEVISTAFFSSTEFVGDATQAVSGTWKLMGGSATSSGGTSIANSVFCRVA